MSRLLLILFFSLPASAAHDPAKIDQLITSLVAGEGVGAELWPEKFRTDLENQSIKLNELLGTDYEDGIGYAARGWKKSKVPFEKLKALLFTKGGIFKISSAVKTQHNFKKFSETDMELKYQLDIKVPIFPDFRTQARLWTYIDKKGRGVMEWQQPGTEGDLTYNRGMVIAEPDGDGTKLFVLGVHIIKPERKIPWYARGTAANVAKKHYSSYLTAVEAVVD